MDKLKKKIEAEWLNDPETGEDVAWNQAIEKVLAILDSAPGLWLEECERPREKSVKIVNADDGVICINFGTHWKFCRLPQADPTVQKVEHHEMASWSYAVAEAMLAERKRRMGGGE